jgi:hypothetical protein
VQNGPFADARLSVSDWNEWTTVPKVLGSYEAELHPTIEDLCEVDYDRIINIGAAEGYYAVGMALRQQSALVYAFEASDQLREQCALNSRINGAEERICIQGRCGVSDLKDIVSEEPGTDLIICDCEGQELGLLHGEIISLLTNTDLLVEIHETVATEERKESATEILTRRFRPTHKITMIPARLRTAERYSALNSLYWDEKPLAISEHRRRSKGWLLMKPEEKTA